MLRQICGLANLVLVSGGALANNSIHEKNVIDFNPVFQFCWSTEEHHFGLAQFFGHLLAQRVVIFRGFYLAHTVFN